MSTDDHSLDAGFDMGAYGCAVLEGVTQLLFSQLAGAKINALHPLFSKDRLAGLAMRTAAGACFNFWVADDELYWGDDHRLCDFDWPGGKELRLGEPL